MISPRAIRDEVISRLKTLRSVDENTIHATYSSVLFLELNEMRTRFLRLRAKMQANRVIHPDRGWIMVSKDQQDELMDLLGEIEKELTR